MAETVTARVQVKFGALELECQGSEIFLKKEMPSLVNELVEICLKHKDAILEIAPVPPLNTQHPQIQPPNQGSLELSTAAIASRIGEDSGPNLILAAAAHLMLVKNKLKFNRAELSEEMRSATSFYKESYGSNLVANINRLVKAKRLNELSNGTYAINANELKDIKGKLA